MNKNLQVVESILKSIEILVEQKIETSTVDKTQQGHITVILPDNRYSLKIHGKEYPHVPSCVDISYTVGESVWVTIPQNNWNQMYICGRRK